jgi:hypothetical protein
MQIEVLIWVESQWLVVRTFSGIILDHPSSEEVVMTSSFSGIRG